MKNSEIQKEILLKLEEIYYSGYEINKDWMGYPITKKNSPTYHHIEKAEELRRNHKSDEATVVNGAYLGKKSHQKLHKLEHIDPDLYEAWAYIFMVISNMAIYPIDDVWKIINSLKEQTEEALYNNEKKLKITNR